MYTDLLYHSENQIQNIINYIINSVGPNVPVQFSVEVEYGSPRLWRHLHNLSEAPAVMADFTLRFFSPAFSWLPVEERMGNSDVINLGTAGQRSMQTLRVPWLVPMCLCPVDGEIDGVVLPACAAPASQHADWSVWSCGMSPSAPRSHSPLLVWMPITGRKIVIWAMSNQAHDEEQHANITCNVCRRRRKHKQILQ